MILVDREIMQLMRGGDLLIEPFDQECLGANSYDVHLDAVLKTYRMRDAGGYATPLDCRVANQTVDHSILEAGVILQPGTLYLGSTIERIDSRTTIPKLNGKSSLGRLGLVVHQTAGEGDYGFCGHWTLELTVVHPLVVYAGMPVAQVLWQRPLCVPERTYAQRPGSKYLNASIPGPQASEMYRNFRKDTTDD